MVRSRGRKTHPMKSLFPILLALLAGVPALPFSSQEDYPWGHQLLHYYCRLWIASQDFPRFRANTGVSRLTENSLPLYGAPRSLLKIPVSVGVRLHDPVILEGEWDALRHREAARPERWDPGDVRFHIALLFNLAGWKTALRFGCKLPNAPNNWDKDEFDLSGGLSGAGTDMTDVDFLAAASRLLGPFRSHFNLGFLILGDPTTMSSQLDLITVAVGLDWRRGPFLLTAEYDGSTGPRRFDNFSGAGGTIRIDRGPFFSALKAIAGLNGSGDDLDLSFLTGFQF